jgi:hypothetical protein
MAYCETDGYISDKTTDAKATVNVTSTVDDVKWKTSMPDDLGWNTSAAATLPTSERTSRRVTRETPYICFEVKLNMADVSNILEKITTDEPPVVHVTLGCSDSNFAIKGATIFSRTMM